jgi:DNA-binding LacI/PurR family transcriptional regulator
VRVPAELSVVGFDDSAPAAWSSPPLTTVRQDLAAKGRIAGELVLRLLAGGAVPESGPVAASASASAEVPVSLVVRGSTAPA